MFSLKIKFGTYFSFLQRAANLTSSLLNNVNKIPIRNLSINILVSGAKLEKFAVQYAQYHWGLKNNSKAEMSIEMDEVGKRFLVRVRGPPGGGGGVGNSRKFFIGSIRPRGPGLHFHETVGEIFVSVFLPPTHVCSLVDPDILLLR